jgi:hypothetical protein
MPSRRSRADPSPTARSSSGLRLKVGESILVETSGPQTAWACTGRNRAVWPARLCGVSPLTRRQVLCLFTLLPGHRVVALKEMGLAIVGTLCPCSGSTASVIIVTDSAAG